MSKINIKLMSDSAYATLRKNINTYEEKFRKYPKDYSWINSITNEAVFETKKYQVEDFELKIPSGPYDRDTDMANAITLYEHLNCLPEYIVTEPRFWLWVMFEKGYEASLASMEKHNATAFSHQWLFVDGVRRGLFFGILSRLYLRTELTYAPENAEDPYYLTRYVMENPLRFREISWRAISNYRFVVKAMLKAERRLNNELSFEERGAYFTDLAKEVCKLGSIKLIDAMSEEEIEDHIYRKYKQIVERALEKEKAEKYVAALEEMVKNTEQSIKKAAKMLTELGDYADSKEMLAKCEKLSKQFKKGLFSSLLKPRK